MRRKSSDDVYVDVVDADGHDDNNDDDENEK